MRKNNQKFKILADEADRENADVGLDEILDTEDNKEPFEPAEPKKDGENTKSA